MEPSAEQPIHCIEKDKILPLIGKKVLFAEHKEGLGYYGTLLGFDDKTGKFAVMPKWGNRKICFCNWIVSYGNQ